MGETSNSCFFLMHLQTDTQTELSNSRRPGHYLYVHVPFCEQKCTYCDFFTITDPDRSHPLASQWLELCARELELWMVAGDVDRAQPVQTIFFGGGTPSLLSPSAID